MAGRVRINGRTARKPSESVQPSDSVAVDAPERYVSRGGYKLEHALEHFRLNVAGQVAIDLGASTGGFTDCLLQHGVARVCAVDVGKGQLAWKLRQDARVTVMEGVNARSLSAPQLPAPFAAADVVVIDCSFISLRKILPSAVELLAPGGIIVALIKPQFEAGRAEADRGAGVITDPRVHERVVCELRSYVDQWGRMRWRAVVESPLRGPAGNREFLVLLEKIR